jgi:hypothetical protein
MNLRQPLNPVIQNGLIMIASGLVASVLCAKVYGATLPVDEPKAPTAAATVATAPAPQSSTDAAAAAQLRAMLMGRPVLLGAPPAPEAHQ